MKMIELRINSQMQLKSKGLTSYVPKAHIEEALHILFIKHGTKLSSHKLVMPDRKII
jgi:nitrogen fixation protein